MIDLVATKPTTTTFAAAVGAIMFAGQVQYPPRTEAYQVYQVGGTYSDFMANLPRTAAIDDFARQIGALYDVFAQRQERLGAEFEAAIFSDVESLYEA
ncbi:hypothetical protein ACFO5X_10960 [Seohaeicola nanhaiensis]|uniref:Uncharacterized protein n=1 Tax=Seohaeicola nanhaiensis TaxID=1387282 RepID=A0ABV9KFX9_9RHOB